MTRRTPTLAALLVVGGLLLAAPSPTASARPTTWQVTTYYSDASMTTVVGRERTGCLGSYRTGVRTAYSASVDGDCR